MTSRLFTPAAVAALLALGSCTDDPVSTGGIHGIAAPEWDITVESFSGGVEALWGQSSTEVYAAGTIFARYDGNVWHPLGLPTPGFGMRGGWGSSSDDIHVYNYGRLYHWNGTVWDYMNFPTFPDWVWGAPSGEIFVPNWRGFVYRFDGSVWRADSVSTGSLYGVWGSSANDVYVAGERGVIAHYDGIAWTTTSIDTAAYLTMAWRVGDGPLRVRSGGRLYEFDGVPELLAPDADLRVNALWPEGPDAFVAAGYVGNMYPVQGAAYRFDGSAWTPIVLSTPEEMRCAWASPTGDAFVGGAGVWRQQGGKTEQILGGDVPSGYIADFWRTPDDQVIAVGEGVYRYDGREWIDLGKEAIAGNTAYAVHGRNENDFCVVGREMVIGYKGESWDWLGTGLLNDLFDVWVDPRGITAVGARGAIVHYDGSTWTHMESYTDQSLYAIWGWEEGAFAVGDNGVILRFDGTAWRPDVSPVSFTLRQVLGFGPHRVVATGDESSEIVVYDGRAWKTVDTGISDPSAWNTSLWGTSFSDLFMAQDEGMVFHYDGRTWSPMSSPLLNYTESIVGLPDGDVLVSGDNVILRYHPR